ncbi:hypothetical protein BGX38DRAFT_1151197 [Terfezia claveryi]|nr:hypothetical protein BGX38DRAFT_1151197 [Terfezia claveryi]
MTEYLACLKRVRGNNDPECRILAKAYLKCRMDKNLMAVDEFKNLGFTENMEKEVGEGGKEKRLSRLDELRMENEELKRKHRKA